MPIKVMHVIARMNTGGTAAFLFTLLSNQNNLNYEQILVTGSVQGSEIEDPRVASLPVIRIPELGRQINLTKDLTARKRLKAAVKEYKPDVIITHTFKAGALIRSLPLRTPVVHTFHGHLLSDPEFSGIAIKAIIAIEKLLARRTAIMSTTGKSVQLGLESAGITHATWRNIHPGILPPPSLSKEVALKNLGIELMNNSNLVIGWHSRFAPVKNVQLVFDIARELPDFNFLVSGGGPLFESFKLQHPKNVHLLGWQKAEDVLGACDILLSTSFNEGLPLALIEASMLGKPCIATDVGSVSEIVVDGETGYFVKPSAADFVEKIQFLNSHRDVLNEMSSKAHTFSRERFQIEFFIKQYEELIESALIPS